MDTADARTGRTLQDGFRIGEVRIDPRTGDVTGPAGLEQLDPKVMGVLLMLAEHAGKVVARDDLLARLWPGVVVSDDALSRCLSELRRQLAAAGGDGSLRALVETLPKRGYRLNAEVVPASTSTQSRRRRVAWPAVALGLVLAVGIAFAIAMLPTSVAPRVAVLPFLDLSPGQDQRWLADGIAEEITDRLAHSPDLKVIARTSAFSLRDRELAVPDIARLLDVTHVLEGSVRRVEDRIRVTAQLITADGGTHLWSQTYERDVNDVFAIQDEIAVEVARRLEATLGATGAKHSTQSVEALVHYAQGEHFYHRRMQGDFERAIAAFEQAVAIDPGYARAWAGLSGAYARLADASSPPDAALRARQGEAARRAVELQPDLAVAHFRIADFLRMQGDESAALRHLREAERLDPGSPMALSFQAITAIGRGDMHEAVDHFRQVVALDPIALSYRTNLAVALAGAGRYEEALAELRRARDLHAGENVGLDGEIVRVLAALRRWPEAAALAAAMPDGREKDQAFALLHRAPGLGEASDLALARLASSGATDAHTEQTVNDCLWLAEAYAMRERVDEAFATLQRCALGAASGNPSDAISLAHLWTEIHLSPFLKPLHRDPRWRSLRREDA